MKSTRFLGLEYLQVRQQPRPRHMGLLLEKQVMADSMNLISAQISFLVRYSMPRCAAMLSAWFWPCQELHHPRGHCVMGTESSCLPRNLVLHWFTYPSSCTPFACSQSSNFSLAKTTTRMQPKSRGLINTTFSTSPSRPSSAPSFVRGS